MKAMILAAGLGTRLKPWTDHHPKALALVNGKSLLQRNIEYLQAFGIFDVIVNVHHFAPQLISAIEANRAWGSNITISDETDVVLETGGGLKKASWFFNEGDFLLMNADILTDLDLHEMIRNHQANHPLATLATTNRETSRYFLFDDNGLLSGWKNLKTGETRIKKESSHYHHKAFSGIHIINPSIFALITREGKFSMVDVYLELAASQQIRAFDHSHSRFIDVGKPEALVRAETLFQV
jgi:MurNAc alpha-1-phosphate uridylyltransferase